MPDEDSAFDQLEKTVAEQGVSAGLDALVARLRAEQSYFELFEALKMRVRHRLGLPIVYDDSGDDLEEPVRRQLEDGLLEACREVGLALLGNGQVRDGWAYLRPVGNRSEAAAALSTIEPGEDNLDELIEVSLHEGVDAARGYALVLAHYGTCNAITSLESLYARLPIPERQKVTAQLVSHLHQELLASVQADIANREGQSPTGQRLADLIAERPWLFGEHSYHIDTTHLASTVRLARVLDDEQTLRLAIDLTDYGRRLSTSYQYAGEEPFRELYPSHGLYLRAVAGDESAAAVAYFEQRANELDPQEHGTQPTEAFIELLDRLGRYDEAVDALLRFAERSPESAPRVFPLLLSLSEKAGGYSELVRYCRAQQDLLGFATGVLCAEGRK